MMVTTLTRGQTDATGTSVRGFELGAVIVYPRGIHDGAILGGHSARFTRNA